jgi:hypothetical protein
MVLKIYRKIYGFLFFVISISLFSVPVDGEAGCPHVISGEESLEFLVSGQH